MIRPMVVSHSIPKLLFVVGSSLSRVDNPVFCAVSLKQEFRNLEHYQTFKNLPCQLDFCTSLRDPHWGRTWR